MCESEGIRHIEIHRKIKDPDEDIQSPHCEQLLHGDSDHVSLDSLLKAVIDISDCLNQQEEKIKKHENILSLGSSGKKRDNGRMFPVTAVRKYVNQESISSDSELDQSQTVSELSSKLSVSTRRSKSFSRNSPSPIKSESRKNISFSNASVRAIDMENQRLLKEILNTKPKTLSQRKGSRPGLRPQSASAVNRQRQQREIERENLRILNRLQSVKATKNLSRDKLLTEHNKSLELSNRISKGTRSRPTSARSTCSIDSRATSKMDMTCDNESVFSSAASVSSIRSSRSSASKATSTKGSRPSSGKKRITRSSVWEPGW